jgi:hypothetical protein
MGAPGSALRAVRVQAPRHAHRSTTRMIRVGEIARSDFAHPTRLPANAAIAAYRAQGLALEHRIRLDGWVTLVMKRPETVSRKR